MKTNNKVMATMVVMVMLAVSFAAVWTADSAAAEDDFESSMSGAPSSMASTVYGEFHISIAYNGSAWTTYDKKGYNAAIAVDSIGLMGLSLDMNYTEWVFKNGFWTYDVNPAYGQIDLPATIGGTVYTSVSIYFYDDASSTWKNASSYTTSLGFYKPFEDYDLKTANIALNFISGVGRMPTMPTALKPLVPISTIDGNDDFKVDFTISADAALLINGYPGQNSMLDAQITYWNTTALQIHGYGSDCYLALKDALGPYYLTLSQSNVIDTNQPYNVNLSYGSVQDMLGFIYETDPYGVPPDQAIGFWYWSLWVGDYMDPYYANFSNWLLGSMSPLDDAAALGQDPWNPSEDFVQNEFYLFYVYS